jgi:hypothetical protein
MPGDNKINTTNIKVDQVCFLLSIITTVADYCFAGKWDEFGDSSSERLWCINRKRDEID